MKKPEPNHSEAMLQEWITYAYSRPRTSRKSVSWINGAKYLAFKLIDSWYVRVMTFPPGITAEEHDVNANAAGHGQAATIEEALAIALLDFHEW